MNEQYTLPEAFSNMMRSRLGQEADAFFEALSQPYAAALRLTPCRGNISEAAAPFLAERVPWCGQGYYIKPDTRPGLSPLHYAGGYYIQEASAMAPAEVLAVQPGELVLDLCAAPGGKSGQLAAALNGEGALVANEPEPTRAKILSATLERLGVTNALVTNAYPHELAAVFEETFDAILVDAPCSGEGMFRREPASRAEWKDGSPEGCAARQAEILDQAAKMLKPGGRLVFSTCTFNDIENEGSVRSFLTRHPDFSARDFALSGVGASQNGMIHLFPHRVRGDGQFAALLVRDGDHPVSRLFTEKTDRDTQKLLTQIGEIAPLPMKNPVRCIRRGDILCALPALIPDPKKLRVLRCGLHLCRVGKNYIEPDHALAMAGNALQTADFSEEEALRLLTGETAFSDGRGWTLITCHHLPLGWGKASGGTLKNHIPKGLRIHL